MDPDRKRALALTLLAAFLGGLVVCALRYTRPVESLELALYDMATASRSSESGEGEDSIVQLVYTEELLAEEGFWEHPVSDVHLAELLAKVLDAGAAAVAVDIYRGVPVPRELEDSPLDGLLQGDPRLLWIHRLGDDSPVRQAPAAVAGDLNRVATDTFPVDAGLSQKVRRGYLTADAGGDTYLSLAFLGAMRFLEANHGLTLALVETNDEEHPYGFQIGKRAFHPFRGRDGAYANADTGGAQLLLEFPRGKFPRRDFKWVVEIGKEELAEFVSGKLVFIGVTASSVKDSFATPVMREHRGIDVHAAFAQQLISASLDPARPRLGWAPEWAENLMVIGAALLGGAGALVLRRLWLLAAALLADILVTLGIGFWCLRMMLWFPSVAIALALPVGAAFAFVAMRSLERRSRLQLRSTLATYLGEKQFALVWGERENLLSEGKVRGTQLPATLMMTDLVGYSATAERLGAGELFEWMDRYRKDIAKLVGEHGGMVQSYAGDAIYGVWGVHDPSQALGEAAAGAVRCALAMRERLARLNERFVEGGMPPIGMRVGINSGTVTAGLMGPAGGMEYAVIGDPVNAAARLESYDKEHIPKGEICRILVGQRTWQLVERAGFRSEAIGEIELRGKAQRMRAYRVLAESE